MTTNSYKSVHKRSAFEDFHAYKEAAEFRACETDLFNISWMILILRIYGTVRAMRKFALDVPRQSRQNTRANSYASQVPDRIQLDDRQTIPKTLFDQSR